MDHSESITLYELLHRVRDVVASGVQDPVWVRAEIGEIKRNPSGHCYLTLVEKDPGTGLAKARVDGIIWSRAFLLIDPMFIHVTGSGLQEGMCVLVHAMVRFTEQYGLSLIIDDVDPSYTIGDMEAARRQTLSRLEQEGMMDMNAGLPLPVLPRRLAVVTSSTAAGWRDFSNHLLGNEYGYRFDIEHFPALMQGEGAERSIIEALDAVAARRDEFDAVLILRGGGSAMDLVCFDGYDLAVNVAQFPLPVLTGIGHDHDCHVVDMVAHTSVKTPTALADYLIGLFAGEQYRIESLAARLRSAVGVVSERRSAVVDGLLMRLRAAVAAVTAEKSKAIDLLEARISAGDPSKALERGCAFILRGGEKIASASSLVRGDVISLLLKDGTVNAVVESVSK